MWRPQLAALQARFTVLGYDTRGHGAEQRQRGRVRLRHACSGCHRPDGPSRRRPGEGHGAVDGRHDRACARARTSRQGRARGLLRCAGRRARRFQGDVDDNIALLDSGGMDAVAERTIPRWFSPAFRADPANASMLASVREMILRTPPEGYRKAARCLQTLDLLRSLDQVSLPVHFIVGELDPGLRCRWSGTWPPAFPGQGCTSFRGPRGSVEPGKPRCVPCGCTDAAGLIAAAGALGWKPARSKSLASVFRISLSTLLVRNSSIAGKGDIVTRTGQWLVIKIRKTVFLQNEVHRLPASAVNLRKGIGPSRPAERKPFLLIPKVGTCPKKFPARAS